eukprot:106987-Chlamydomonas_euryale.AAC.2
MPAPGEAAAAAVSAAAVAATVAAAPRAGWLLRPASVISDLRQRACNGAKATRVEEEAGDKQRPGPRTSDESNDAWLLVPDAWLV